MHNLFDQTFWRFLSGFIVILVISLSLLTLAGVWREAKESRVAVLEAFRRD